MAANDVRNDADPEPLNAVRVIPTVLNVPIDARTFIKFFVRPGKYTANKTR